jgi:hypothetical protein
MAGGLTLFIILTAIVVVTALFTVLWRQSESSHDHVVALLVGAALAVWLAGTTVLAYDGYFLPTPDERVPSVGVSLVLGLAAMGLLVLVSPSLRGLLGHPASLIRLHCWRLVGVTFLMLMLSGSLPVEFALPAGLGDVLIGATAFWVADHVDHPRGHLRALVWSWLGLVDLVLAIVLGVGTNPGPAQFIRTVPTSAAMTQFPMALVPTFLVPIALVLHVVTLWQLYKGAWARPSSQPRIEQPRRQPA